MIHQLYEGPVRRLQHRRGSSHSFIFPFLYIFHSCTSSCSSCIPLNPPNSHNSCYSVNLLRSIAVKRLLRMCRQYFCRNKLGDASLRRFSSKVVRHRGLCGCPGNARTWFCKSLRRSSWRSDESPPHPPAPSRHPTQPSICPLEPSG